VLIVDDVLTAATAVRESFDIIERRGAVVAGVVISLDRTGAGRGSVGGPGNREAPWNSGDLHREPRRPDELPGTAPNSGRISTDQEYRQLTGRTSCVPDDGVSVLSPCWPWLRRRRSSAMYKCVMRGARPITRRFAPECLGRDTQELNKSVADTKNPAYPLDPRAGAGARSRAQEKLEEEEKSKRSAARTWRCSTRIQREGLDACRARALRNEDAITATEKGASPGAEAPRGAGIEKEFST